jgi:hypothetical protein
MPEITLREAITLYASEPGATANAYEWYRRWAHYNGNAPIGGTEVPARKRAGAWKVASEDVTAAIEGHRRTLGRRRAITDDYGRGVLHGLDGESVLTDWGDYRHRGPFHLARSGYEAARHRSDGAWMCSSCMKAAETEHTRPECHRCSDWGDCRSDCTLSRVFCPTCETSLRV